MIAKQLKSAHARTAIEIGLFAFIAWVRLSSPGMSWFNEHMSRDLARALDWKELHPHTILGPELDLNGHLPGPFYYLWLSFGLSIGRSLLLSLTFLRGLMILPLWLVYREVRRELGMRYGLIFLLMFAVLPIHVYVSRSIWNPSLVVSIQLLSFYFFTKAIRGSKQSLAGFFLTALAGTHTHFSTLSSLLSGSVLLLNRGTKSIKRLVVVGLLLTACSALSIWLIYPGSAPHATASGRGFNFSKPISLDGLRFFIQQYDYHLLFTGRSLGDYDVFPLFFRYGRTLQVTLFSWIESLLPWAQLFWSIALILSVIGLIAFRFSRRSPSSGNDFTLRAWSDQVLCQLCVSLLPMYYYVGRGNRIPFRYGLMIYPALALVVPLFLARLSLFYGPSAWIQKIKKPLPGLTIAILIFAMGVFIIETEFNLKTYQFMSSTGRAANTGDDDLEMPLKYKLDLLQLIGVPQLGESAYARGHGPIVNRVRMFEYSTDSKNYFGGLARAIEKDSAPLPNPLPTLTESFELTDFTTEEMTENFHSLSPVFPFHLVPLNAEEVPNETKIEGLDKNFRVVSSGPVPNGSLLLPLKVIEKLPNASEIAFLRVHFKVLPSRSHFLKLSFDKSSAETLLDLIRIRADGKELPFSLPGYVPWREQTLAIAQLEPGSHWVQMEAEFKVGAREHEESRLDLWLSSDERRPTAH